MCTLTYLPTPEGGFILTSNRDELPGRSPLAPPGAHLHHNHTLIYAKDAKAGGTWLAAADNGYTLCLLNGAFNRHTHQPPYRQSRGLVIPDFFAFPNVDDFIKHYPFSGLEPFTLIIIHKTRHTNVYELRWDGLTLHHQMKAAHKPHIWSSVTLYAPEVIAEREHWFRDFLSITPAPHLHDMLHFHHFGGNGDSGNSLVMERNKVKTLSISSIKHCVDGYFMIHEDLHQKQFCMEPIHVKNPA